MALPRYTLGTGKAKKKVKKPDSVHARIAMLLKGSSNKSENGRVNGPPPKMMFSPKAPAVPRQVTRSDRYMRLHPEDRALLVEAIALLKRSLWGEPEIVSEDEPQETQEEVQEEAVGDAPVLRTDELEDDQPA